MIKFNFSLLLIILAVITISIFYKLRVQSKPVVQSKITVTTPTQNPNTISNGAVPNIPFKLPPGYTIHVFASNLNNPRDLQFSPGGTLLVSDTADNRILALPDKNHDGVADSVKIVASNENHVHGLAFYNNQLFIANVDQVVRYNWDENTLTATKDKVLFPLPENSDHNNRTLVFDSNGKMYISLGSTCNICKETPQIGGSVLISDANGTPPQIYATGLRNAAFLAFNPQTNDLWVTEMGRDYLDDNTPPDEINIVKQSQDYGWPYCYGDKVHDDSFDPLQMHSCNTSVSPIYNIPAHSAPLGLVFINSPQFAPWQGDLLVAYHGSWNRSVAIGYKVVRLKVNNNSILNSEDFITGFNPGTTNADSLGRPVDLIFDQKGNLYLSDDKAGNIYIIQKQ